MTNKIPSSLKPLLLIFFADAVAMTIEMVAARILSPYFGSSNAVWTAVIGVILLASSIGNYFGGRMADRHNLDKMIRNLMVATAAWLLMVGLLGEVATVLLAKHIHLVEIGALVASVLLFLSPAAALGMATPMLMRRTLQGKENGEMTGKFYAVMTAGGLTGTFMGGFVLIPAMGCIQMLCVMAMALAWMAFFTKPNKTVFYLSLLLTTLGLFVSSFWKHFNEKEDGQILSNQLYSKISLDTHNGHVSIYNGLNAEGDSVRLMNVDGGHMSATYLNPAKKYELPFRYTRAYDLAVNQTNSKPHVLMIGGAGYSYPKYFISHFPDSKMDVVELDPDITEIARKYFFLADLEKEFKTRKNKRLQIFHCDGRVFLNNTNSKYDIIMNDAFTGEVPVRQLATLEAARQIKKCLLPNGIYATNVITSNRKLSFPRCEYLTLSKVFRHVYVAPVEDRSKTTQNLMFLASDRPLSLPDTIFIHHLPEDVVFTDDFSPVEQLNSYLHLKNLSLSGEEQLSKTNK